MAPGNPSDLTQSQVVREFFPELPSFRVRMFQQTVVRGNLGNPTSDTAVQSPATIVLSKKQQSNCRKINIGVPLPDVTYNQNKKPSNCVLHSVPCLTEHQCKTLQTKQRVYNVQEPTQIFQGSQSYLQQVSRTNFQSNSQMSLNQDSTMQNRNNGSCQQNLRKTVLQCEQHKELNSQQSSLYQERNISLKRHKSENINETNPNTRFQKLQIHVQSQQHSAENLNDQQISSDLNQQNCQSGFQLQQTSSSSQTENKNLHTQQNNTQSHEQYTSRNQCQQTSPESETQHSFDQQSNNQPTQHIPSTAQQYLQTCHPQHVRSLPFYYNAFCPIQPQYIPQYYSQTFLQHPLCYQPTMQQIQFPQAIYQPHETRWNVPQNVAIPTTIVNGPQRVESLNPVHVVSRASGGIQSYPTVPRSNYIQLHLDKPKVINLHSSMLSQTSLPVSVTDTNCTNKLQSSDSDQICQRSISVINNSNGSDAAIQTEETPTCSKYLQPEVTLPVSRNDSSFSTNTVSLKTMKQIKNSVSESSVSQEHKNDVFSVEMQPIDKISNNESNETKGKQSRFNMETITEDIIMPILSPVLWNSSGMAHPLKAVQNKTSEKREHTPQHEKTPSKKRSKKRKT